MKKVILNEYKSEVVICALTSSDKYYGVCTSHASGFIVRELGNRSQAFTILCANNLTGGNGWPTFARQNLSDVLSALLANGGFDIYEFDTAEELFAWLATKPRRKSSAE